MSVEVVHNILWSKYKGGVFGCLYRKSIEQKINFNFVQIAETEGDRVGLSVVDKSYHCYPYKLFFEGSYNDIALWRLVSALVKEVWFSKAELFILPGYHRPEYWAMLCACIIRRKKRAVFCDSTAFDRPSGVFKSLAKRVFFHFCDGYFGYGLRSRAYLLSLGAKQDCIFHRCQAAAMPHGYSTDLALRTRLENFGEGSDIRFLYVGRLAKEKGIDTLLNAFKLVLLDRPDAKLVFVGSGYLQSDIENYVVKLGICNNVEFLGSMAIESLALEYAKATCLVLPSEPWGLVVNEALSYGCPVVVSNVCGCVPELVRFGITGFDFEVGDVGGLAAFLLKIVRDFGDSEAVAKRCIDVVSQYSPERAAQQIFDGSMAILRGRIA